MPVIQELTGKAASFVNYGTIHLWLEFDVAKEAVRTKLRKAI